MEPDAPTKPTMSDRRTIAHRWFALTLAGMAVLAALLRALPPETNGFYPVCPFRQWTGLLCPGCGATRALAALVHGRLAEALRWNGLVIVALVVCVAWLALAYVRAIRGRHPTWPVFPRPAVAAAIASALAFTLARNLH